MAKTELQVVNFAPPWEVMAPADEAGMDWEADALSEIATIMSCFEPVARRRLMVYLMDRWGRDER